MNSMRGLYLLAKDTYAGIREERRIERIHAFPWRCGCVSTTIYQLLTSNRFFGLAHVCPKNSTSISWRASVLLAFAVLGGPDVGWELERWISTLDGSKRANEHTTYMTHISIPSYAPLSRRITFPAPPSSASDNIHVYQYRA